MSNYVRRENYKKIIIFILLNLCILMMTSCSVAKDLLELGENKLMGEVFSPNGKYKAIVFERNVGATTDYSYHISILKQDCKLKNSDVGNVFISSNKAEISWLNNKNITITHSRDFKIYKKIDEIDGI